MHPHEDQIVEGMLAAYRQGYFPMAEPSFGPAAPLLWLSPDPRGVIPLTEEEGFHVPRRLREKMRRLPPPFELTSDQAFQAVVEGCAEPRTYEKGTWIDERIIELFLLMHERGHAHSIEAWLRGEDGTRELVGGTYGMHIGGAFFAESKFCRPQRGGTDASKVVLVTLVEHLRHQGFSLLDVQMWNEHLNQFGCKEIPRAEYLRRLGTAVKTQTEWGTLRP